MLLPSSSIQSWYRRGSFVYRNFAFLFANPLWTKRVPAGFSVCPMFWLSLFSLLILRPLVYLTLALRWAVKLLHLERVLKLTDAISPIKCETRGLGTTATLALLAVWGGLMAIMWCVPHPSCSPNSLPGMRAFVTLLLVCAFHAIYQSQQDGNPKRCKTIWWVAVAGVLAALYLAVVAPYIYVKLLVVIPLAILHAAWVVVSAIGGWLWHALVWIITGLLGASLWFLLGLPLVAFAYAVLYHMDIPLSTLPEVAPEVVEANRKAMFDFVADRDMREFHRGISTKLIRLILGGYVPLYLQMLYRPTAEIATPEASEALWQAWLAGKAQYDQDKASTQAQWDARCQAFSEALARLFGPVWRAVAPATANLWTFLCYLAILAKSFKSKACPYLTFTD